MKTGSIKNKEKANSETKIHDWLKGADLGKLASKKNFKPTRFGKLEPTNWDHLYNDFQKSKPISIRLPVRIIDKMKQVALQQGIAYQSLIRMWLTEKLSG